MLWSELLFLLAECFGHITIPVSETDLIRGTVKSLCVWSSFFVFLLWLKVPFWVGYCLFFRIPFGWMIHCGHRVLGLSLTVTSIGGSDSGVGSGSGGGAGVSI